MASPAVLPEEPTALPPPASAASGGLFTSPSGLLAFLAAIAGSRLALEATCRRAPDGAYWADVEVSWDAASAYVRTAGGRAFEAFGDHWLELPLLDAPSEAGRRRTPVLDVRSWPLIELAELLCALPLRRSRFLGAPTLDVVVPGALGRWVLRRALALGLKARLTTASCRPLRGKEPSAGVLWIRLESEQGNIPLSLIEALSNLPYAVVGRPVGPPVECGEPGGRLLVDVRFRPPLLESLLVRMIPAGEAWLLAGPDVGHRRLDASGAWVEGADLLQAPEIAYAEAPAEPPATWPEPLPVRLIERPASSARSTWDAVLLDDQELDWLQRFMRTRPLAERVFLIPGKDRHFLTAPGGFGGALPFGLSLEAIGPGGLYLESGLIFFPPLPAAARREVFALDENEVVVVAGEAAWRFALDRLVPAWSLWVGQAPEILPQLSAGPQVFLSGLEQALRLPERRPLRPDAAPKRQPPPEMSREQLIAEALQAELRGNLAAAAGLMERAGELGPAGRLYERAAAILR
jgi:hypothetical protein